MNKVNVAETHVHTCSVAAFPTSFLDTNTSEYHLDGYFGLGRTIRDKLAMEEVSLIIYDRQTVTKEAHAISALSSTPYC